MLYREEGTADLTKMNTFRVTENDMLVGFHLRNFELNRTTIRAGYSISAEVDSLKIIAAQKVIEEEI